VEPVRVNATFARILRAAGLPGGRHRRARWWLALWLVAVPAATAFGTGPAGVNGFHAYIPQPFAENRAAIAPYMAWEAEQMAGAGLAWNRTLSPRGGPFKWGDIQVSQGGPYDWSHPDLLVSQTQAQGIRLLAVVHPFTRWDQPSASDIQYCTPTDATAWTAFLTALVERYDGDGIQDMPGLVVPIKHWEISNEVEANFCNGDAARYAAFLAQAYATIKAADPTATVLNGSTSPIYDPRRPSQVSSPVREFWQAFFAAGGGAYMDAFGVHATSPEPALPLRAFLGQYQALLDSHGLRTPMWLTETGTYSGSPVKDRVTYPAQSTTYQAAWWVKHVSYALAHNVVRVFQTILDAHEDMVAPTGDDWLDGTGWIDSDVRWDQGPRRKPVYFSNQKLASLTAGSSTVTELAYADTCGTERVEAQCTSRGAYRYDGGSGSVWVLWNDAGGRDEVDVGSTVARATVISSVPRLDAAGRPVLDAEGRATFESSEVDVVDGRVTVVLSSVPVFVLASPRAAFRATATGSSTSLTLTATLQVAREDVGRPGHIYVGASVAGRWFFLTPQGWVAWTTGVLPVYASGTLVSQSLPIATGVDVSGLAGARVYVGYGLTEADMLGNGKYGLVYTVP